MVDACKPIVRAAARTEQCSAIVRKMRRSFQSNCCSCATARAEFASCMCDRRSAYLRPSPQQEGAKMGNQESRVIVITGAGSGIGYSTAEYLAQRGQQTVLFGRSEEQLMTAARQIPRSLPVVGDVTRALDVGQLFEVVAQRFGRLDGLFVNAGVAEFTSLVDADVDQYQRLFDTNVKGAFLTLQKALPLLGPGSSVVFTSSVAADIGAPWCSLYGASKGAVTAFARNAAAELLGKGVRVNVISPGPTETP